MLSRRQVWKETRSRERSENPKEKERVRDRPAVPTGKSPSGRENQPTCITFEKVNFLKRDVITECSFHQRGEAKQRNEIAKTLDHTQAGKDTSLKFRAKGDFRHGVSAIPVVSNL